MSDLQIRQAFGFVHGQSFINEAEYRRLRLTQSQFTNWDELSFEEAFNSTKPVRHGYRF